MSLNWRELELVLSELPLKGSYIQKVTEHTVHSFTLSMYSQQEKAWLLYFEIATPDARVVRTRVMREKAKNAQRFTQYMRAHLVGRKITNVRQLPFDRAFIMDAENSEGRIRIIVRLFSGIGANVIITDDQFCILPQYLYSLTGKEGQEGIEHAVFRFVNGGEYTGDDNYGENIWNVVYDTEEILPLYLFPGEYGGKGQGKEEGNDGDHHYKQNSILHGADELGILKQHFKVVQPHKGLRRRIGAPLKKGHTEDVQRGDDHEDCKQNHGRSNTEEYEAAAAFALQHITAPFQFLTCIAVIKGGGQ